MANNESTASSKLVTFFEKNVKVICGVVAVLIVFVAIIVIGSSINTKATEKSISALDNIDYTFRKDIDGLSAEDVLARQDKALEDVEAYASKGGIVGVRANMLKAEILFQKKDYENSRNAWAKAADTKKSAYTAPICNYNAAACAENLNDLESAVAFYSKAVKADEFYLVDHAYFSLGRVNEAKGDAEAAVAAYEKLNDLHPTSKWASLAKDRIITLKASKAE